MPLDRKIPEGDSKATTREPGDQPCVCQSRLG